MITRSDQNNSVRPESLSSRSREEKADGAEGVDDVDSAVENGRHHSEPLSKYKPPMRVMRRLR